VNNATVTRDSFTVPLIDIQWIGTLETCDLCGDEFPMSWVRFTGRQFLCAACDGEVGSNPPADL
jgi:hypothetical protein